MTAHYLEPIEDGSEKIIRRHIPPGFAWLAWVTPGKTAYKLLVALSKVFDDAWSELARVVGVELSPYKTIDLLPEWEKALSLPDRCIGPQETIQQRRDMLLFRLLRKRWTTIQDWREIAELFGVEARFTPGDYLSEDIGYGDYDYPIIYGGFHAGGVYRVYIELLNCGTEGYDYTYPFNYPTEVVACKRLRCILERIRPACVIFIWDSPPEVPETIYDTWDMDTLTFDSSEAF